jgi:hypothetical protein
MPDNVKQSQDCDNTHDDVIHNPLSLPFRFNEVHTDQSEGSGQKNQTQIHFNDVFHWFHRLLDECCFIGLDYCFGPLQRAKDFSPLPAVKKMVKALFSIGYRQPETGNRQPLLLHIHGLDPDDRIPGTFLPFVFIVGIQVEGRKSPPTLFGNAEGENTVTVGKNGLEHE